MAETTGREEAADAGWNMPTKYLPPPLGSRDLQLVGVVYEAEEHGYDFFQIGERGGMLRVGHLLLLVVGSLMAPFVLPNHATLI